MKDALTTGDVAKYCGVNFRTIIRWIEKGYLDAYKLPGRGDNRIPVASFVAFLRSNNMPVPEEFKDVEASEANTDTKNQSVNDGSDIAAKPNETSASSNSDKPEKPKVLIIEDEALMAKSIERVIRRAGYEVALAANGIEAGIMLERFKPDLITLDLQMPGMSGFEVLEALKANQSYQDIKVLVVSAATKVKLLEVMELGVDGVLEKPFKSEDLLARVQEIKPI